MALDQSALLELLEVLRVADVGDRVRQAAETIYQALIEAELTEAIGAAPHQRSGERTAQRNGHRSRILSTPAGDLELRIPKAAHRLVLPLAAGAAPPGRPGAVRGGDGGYLHGVSTRKVDDLVKALGADTGISKSEVSRICQDLDAEVGAFTGRAAIPVRVPRCHLLLQGPRRPVGLANWVQPC
jgi:putative transposase